MSDVLPAVVVFSSLPIILNSVWIEVRMSVWVGVTAQHQRFMHDFRRRCHKFLHQVCSFKVGFALRAYARGRAPATWHHHILALDSVFDAWIDGQNLRRLVVVDELEREFLIIDVAGSIHSARVVDAHTRLIGQHGASRHLRGDNGLKFAGRSDPAVVRLCTH